MNKSLLLLFKWIQYIIEGRATAETALISLIGILASVAVISDFPNNVVIACIILICGIIYVMIYKAKTEREHKVLKIDNLQKSMTALTSGFTKKMQLSEDNVKKFSTLALQLQNEVKNIKQAMDGELYDG